MVFYHTYVDLSLPLNPLKYIDTHKTHKSITLHDVIKKHAPQFDHQSQVKLRKILFNGHLQTVYTSYMQPFDSFPTQNAHGAYYKRLVLNYPDGGEGTLDISTSHQNFSTKNEKDLEQKNHTNQTKELPKNIAFLQNGELEHLINSKSQSPLVIILHGLTGGSNENYVVSLVQEFQSNNINPLVLNSRGCAFSTLTTPLLYNGLWTDDVRYAVNYLKEKFPERKMYLIGISLGASVLTNYLGQEGDDSKIEMGIALSVPWNMSLSAQFLNSSTMGKIYSRFMAGNCLKLLENNMDVLKKTENPYLNYSTETMKNVELLIDFDDAYTAKMFGFNTAGEYYRHASCVNRLLAIRTPYIAVNSVDDPIVGPFIPATEAKHNPYVHLVTTEKGGHVGWIDPHNGRWFVKPIVGLIKGFHTDVVLNENIVTADVKDKLPRKNKFINDRLVM